MKHTARTVIGALGAGALLASGVGLGVWKLDPAWSNSTPKDTAGVPVPSSTKQTSTKTTPSSSSSPEVAPSTPAYQPEPPIVKEHSTGTVNHDDPLLPPNAYIPQETPQPVPSAVPEEEPQPAPSTEEAPSSTEAPTPSAPIFEPEIPLIPTPPDVDLDSPEAPSTEPQEPARKPWELWGTVGRIG